MRDAVQEAKNDSTAFTAGVILGIIVILIWTCCTILAGWGIYMWSWLPVQRAVGIFVMSLPFAAISFFLINET